MISTTTAIAPEKLLSKKDQARADAAKAIAYLRNDYLKVGDTVYTLIRHTAKSGLTRYVDLFIIKDGKPLRISWNTAKALGYRYDRDHNAIRIRGYGFNAGHSIVSDLAWRLFGNEGSLVHYDF